MKLEPEEPFKSKWKKAYLRTSKKDLRKRVDLYNSETDRTTISYARYLKSVEVGYILGKDVEVDHIDKDKTNDVLSNLQILTVEEHKEKSSIEKSTGLACVELVCSYCNKNFMREVRNTRKKYNKTFCSRICMGKVAYQYLDNN